MDAVQKVAGSYEIATHVAQLHLKRTKRAQKRFSTRLAKAYSDCTESLSSRADSVVTRLASCAVAALVDHVRREAAGKSIA